ncbi:hypothetical protein Despr_2451 [Desulfobulbus propionicus DSM 2032]|uniref:Type I restriction modification DNA specificity domain-containing protein n=1 Tax=Desulfobulbus propionicus (strain ATCC 33891 / DSM 2032 / VKM B-1956 / 1pr3) TaxID=577650 RepID=A0A7U3YNE4_DESPD|nr:hypothetical protein [Desulfobulbus propionicus]ADW18590.1 hypothetical protein Despr_2451 [Desulfobulbus propionicus DSM 2032]
MSEIQFSEALSGTKTSRIDPEYFNRAATKTLKMIKGTLRLGDLVQDGYRVVYETTEAIDREEGERLGLPYFLQSADISTPFINAKSMVCVALSDWERYPKGRIIPGELLIEVKGKAEKIALVPDDFPKNTLVTGTCFKLTTKQRVDQYFLASYLTCRYGQALKDRLKSNLLVSYIAKDDLYRLPIPDLSPEIKLKIKFCFDRCFEAHEEAQSLMDEAETTLLRALGLENWQAPESLSYVRNSRDAFAAGRLDAEHFQEKYYAAKTALIKAGAKCFIPFPELLESLTNGHTPLRHDLSKGEVPFLCAEHVNDFNIKFDSEKRILLEHHGKELARTAVHDGDVLLTIKGRIGNAAIAENVPGAVNINQDVALLRLNETLPIWYIVAYLNCRFGKLQSEKMATGAINPFLGLFSVRRFEVPEFEYETMQEIADSTQSLVKSSRSAWQKASQFLDTAKRAIEIAIEENETAAMAYLEGAV